VITPDLLNVLGEKVSGREFNVEFIGERQTYKIKFVFDVGGHVMEQVTHGKTKATFQFIGSELQ
jgi:hypothetical protein